MSKPPRKKLNANWLKFTLMTEITSNVRTLGIFYIWLF